MRFLLYYTFKFLIKIGLFFYSKRITVLGSNNIPKKGAILFTSNHPNALIDPLLIATNTKRKIHFLVRAAVFKKAVVANFLDLLGMMPIYRIRDGIKQVSKNEEIFNKCQEILNRNETLLIFPEGSHNRKRTIRPLSKGFTRIVYRTLEKHPDLKIHIVPVGITYQNSSNYPSEVTIIYGEPILANDFYNTENINSSVKNLKNEVSNQLKELSVHINNDDNYNATLDKLNSANVNFTDVRSINSIIKREDHPIKKQNNKKRKSLLFYSIIINSFIPYLIWKKLSKKVDETEFIDTFRFGLSIVLIPLFLSLQSCILGLFLGWKTACIYFTTSVLLILLYTKIAPTPAE
jgi:1-acyl-sn-glycerol-3-phosphate acyltransferase